MNYYTYVLLSQKNKRLYIGSTENLEKRIERHNKGRVKSTKAGRPWKLLENRYLVLAAKRIDMRCF
ncbi:MAG: GIY-YIG nuclease family protein [Candidatus Moranbacteria bacterium]|nr:GIY-YIG nuclease family protein [Candidatus Moranbacteria bacterium]